jgi:hypothetical protein
VGTDRAPPHAHPTSMRLAPRPVDLPMVALAHDPRPQGSQSRRQRRRSRPCFHLRSPSRRVVGAVANLLGCQGAPRQAEPRQKRQQQVPSAQVLEESVYGFS